MTVNLQNKIHSLLSEGATITYVAKLLGLNYKTVWYHAKKSPRKFNPQLATLMRLQGFTYEQIAINLSPYDPFSPEYVRQTISQYLNKGKR
jgi:hypothetical protein